MWAPVGKPVEPSLLGSIEPSETLYEFDGESLTFVAHDPTGDLLLVHSLCVFERKSRYLVSAVDEKILGDLRAGRLDLSSALSQPRSWIADIDEDGAVISLWRAASAVAPASVLPRPGVMLTPDLEPLFRIRLLGEGVGPGKTSVTDVR